MHCKKDFFWLYAGIGHMDKEICKQFCRAVQAFWHLACWFEIMWKLLLQGVHWCLMQGCLPAKLLFYLDKLCWRFWHSPFMAKSPLTDKTDPSHVQAGQAKDRIPEKFIWKTTKKLEYVWRQEVLQSLSSPIMNEGDTVSAPDHQVLKRN